jgi:hypothetical protein
MKHPIDQKVSRRIAAYVATLSALAAIGTSKRTDGMLVWVDSEDAIYVFSQAATATDASGLLVQAPTVGSGRWLRVRGTHRLRMPITFATADAAALLTMPAGAVLQPLEFFWDITTGFTGGTSSAIGVSSGKTSFTTKGDLLGGASGDVAAGLTTALSPAVGTIGTGFDTLAKRRKLWVAGDTFRFDRITSVFTAGVGAVNVICNVIQNDGA